MKIIIEAEAQETINDIAGLIDGIHTPGAGERWTDRILDFITGFARPKVKYALCHNKDLAAELYSCITYNNWVIVFRIEKNVFTVFCPKIILWFQ